jgi:histidinol-phosphate phosphatase family protein
MKQLVVLAGGSGTRLRERLGDLPKPMIPIGGRPLLEIQLELAKRHGFDDILIFAFYRADLIEKHFGDGSRFGVRIRYIIETEPLGTAGAVLAGFELLADDFVVMYGDTMIAVDLDRIWGAHKAGAADATLLLHPSDHPADSDLVEVNALGWITAFYNRPHSPDQWFQNRVNAALYVVRKSALAAWSGSAGKMDFAEDLFPAMLDGGARLLAYNSPEFIKDIGTPQRYDAVCAAYAAGAVERSSLSVPRPAVFLDRDGTLVREVGPRGLRSHEELELLPGAADAVRALNNCGLLVVVVTNQPVVAKGFCTEPELAIIHNKLETLLGRESAYVDRIYYCPHYPQAGFPGERPELKIPCDCRKPETGMIDRATREFNIDIEQSWLIGDSTSDMLCARKSGLCGVLVRTGHSGNDGKYVVTPDHECDNLGDAARLITGQLACR